MAIQSFAGRRPAVLIAIAVVLIVILVVVLGGRRGGGSGASALDSGLQRSGGRVAAVLDQPKAILPVPDGTFRSFQAWYYDLKAAYPQAGKQAARGQFAEFQIFDRDVFPPVLLQQFPAGGSFLILDAATVNGVLKNHQPAYTTITVSGHSYRAYVAPLTVPTNLQPATVGGYFAVLQATG